MDSIINSFKPKKSLNSEIWDNTGSTDFKQINIKPEIREKLLQITTTFVKSFELENIEIEDVIIVGSLVNYNWSKYSDIDLHILLDGNSINTDQKLVEQLFDAKTTSFNVKHNIKIKGYDVEVYAQDLEHKLNSKGIYSILYNSWIDTPEKEDFILDKPKIVKKVKQFEKQLEVILNDDDNDDKILKLKHLREKIRKYRNVGLTSNGELSTENLVFKYLRRSGFMDKLKETKNKIEDKILSVENIEL